MISLCWAVASFSLGESRFLRFSSPFVGRYAFTMSREPLVVCMERKRVLNPDGEGHMSIMYGFREVLTSVRTRPW